MKKYLAIVLSALMLFSLVACGGRTPANETEEPKGNAGEAEETAVAENAEATNPAEPFVPDTDVYALLYADGELVFQHGDTPEAGREVVETYPVDLLNGYVLNHVQTTCTTPWYHNRESITKARFADRIQPVSTSVWFYGCENLLEIANIENLSTSQVTDMYCVFRGCSGLTALDVSGFDTSNVTNMGGMFEGCSGLTGLDVSGFDTSHVTYMHYMFSDCSGLTALDVSHFDTSHVTNMGDMFYGCGGLTALDVSRFDTSHVTTMSNMFRYCNRLTALDVSHFDTSNVTTMSNMFYNCNRLTALDVSRFDTSNVTNMLSIFSGCSGLTAIEVSASFVTDSVEQSDDMFKDCTSLVGGAGTVYDENHIDVEYAQIDGGASAPGYFTLKTA